MVLRILVACEFSGTVRDAFSVLGHDAISADLLSTESPGAHVIGDVRPLLRERWDMVIAFPPCTYLCNSGVRWLGQEGDRWSKMQEAAGFFLECLNANAPYVAVENPVMHGYGLAAIGRSPSFTIQPWQFGHGEVKRTCFWTVGLPRLVPTHIVAGRNPRVHNEPVHPDRWKRRSVTYPGIAKAMAVQWGEFVRNNPFRF